MIWDGSRRGAVIDPGFLEEYEERQFLSFLKAQEIDLQSIFLTHAHIDHIYGVSACIKAFPGIKVYSNEAVLCQRTGASLSEKLRLFRWA